jgi:uncharacterized integral membrane protein
MWRLVGFIIVFALFLVFIAFNLGNSCNVSFGFKEFEAVPVYLTAFAAWALGMLCSIPIVISAGLKRSRKNKDPAAQKPKKRWGKKQPDSDGGAAPLTEEPAPPSPVDEAPVYGKDGPYGIN